MNNFPQIPTMCLALLCFAVTGCDPSGSQPSTAELEAQLEQMENQIGRLEFRVFELEQQLGENRNDAPQPDSATPATASPADQGRYDLTPVE